MQINEKQLAQVNHQIQRLIAADNFYGKRLKEAGVDHVSSVEDFLNLPFSEKQDLREAYPLGLMTCKEEEVVRIHSSSGTTGMPVIIPYTAKDVDDWGEMFKRCYEFAGITKKDRIHITPGYGLWTLFFWRKRSRSAASRTRSTSKRALSDPSAGVRRCASAFPQSWVLSCMIFTD